MKDQFNKSISTKIGYGDGRGDKSVVMGERSGFGLQNQEMDRSMIQRTGDRSILKGMGLYPEQLRFEDKQDQGASVEESRNQSQILKDISLDHETTNLDQTMSNLNDISNINDATGL